MALAKTIVSKANFLMLDEPTNHLDIHSVELLIEALKKYEGTLILVSHDRYFISKTANKIWEIVDHEIKEFKGGYDEYVAWNERMAANEKKQVKEKQQAAESKPAVTEKPVEAKEAKVQNLDRDQQKELLRLQKQFSKLEEQIEQLKKEKTKFELDLSAPDSYSDKNKFTQLESGYKAVQQKIAAANTEYETLFEKIMQLEA